MLNDIVKVTICDETREGVVVFEGSSEDKPTGWQNTVQVVEFQGIEGVSVYVARLNGCVVCFPCTKEMAFTAATKALLKMDV